MEVFTSPIILMIVGLIIVILGIGAGMLISSLNDDSEPQEEETDPTPPGGRKGRYAPVARLWRARETDALIVEIDGKSYVAPDPLSDEQRELMEHAARDLRAWMGMGLAAAEPPQIAAVHPIAPAGNGIEHPAQSTPQAGVDGKPAAVVGSAAAESATDRADKAALPAQTNSAQVYRTVPAPYVPAVVKSGDDAVVSPAKPRSIVMQIEDILQDMIAGTALAHQGIHLVEDPMRGVIVQVGLLHYEGIEAVPDGEIKATIRAAVETWENSQ